MRLCPIFSFKNCAWHMGEHVNEFFDGFCSKIFLYNFLHAGIPRFALDRVLMITGSI